MINSSERVALVVSHPAHAIMIAGMVQRYKPDILVIGKSMVQESILRQGLALFGVEDSATFLEIDDSESYEHVLAGDYQFLIDLGMHISEWLSEIRPKVIIGDAFELSNFQHDVTRLLLDNALKAYRTQREDVENYEIPICCRTEEGTHNLMFQRFPFGEYKLFNLSSEESLVKQRLAIWASQHDEFISKVCNLVSDVQKEPYRSVSWNRNYTIPPTGLKKHYDDRGREEVISGRYAKPVLFDEHFIPLVHLLEGA